MKINAAFGGNPVVKPTPNTTSQPRQIPKEEMDFYRKYNQSSDVMWNVNGKNGQRVDFNDAICWDLPANGTGFTTYNVDDLFKKRNDDYGYDQIGTKEIIEAIIEIGRQWSSIQLDSGELRQKLEIGDISRPGGINTPDHDSHINGKIFDMRLLRKIQSDGKGFTYIDSLKYSFSLMKKFILMVVKLYPGTTFFFNDKAIIDDAETGKYVKNKPKHNDHIHVMFPGGVE